MENQIQNGAALLRPRLVRPLPCPFCGSEVQVLDNYDSRSGWGDKTNGWVQCRCGANIGAATPGSPYPTLEKAEVIARWNRRQNAIGEARREGTPPQE